MKESERSANKSGLLTALLLLALCLLLGTLPASAREQTGGDALNLLRRDRKKANKL